MGATNERGEVCSPKVIEEFAAFLVLAPKHPQAGFNVVHSNSLPHKIWSQRLGAHFELAPAILCAMASKSFCFFSLIPDNALANKRSSR